MALECFSKIFFLTVGAVCALVTCSNALDPKGRCGLPLIAKSQMPSVDVMRIMGVWHEYLFFTLVSQIRANDVHYYTPIGVVSENPLVVAVNWSVPLYDKANISSDWRCSEIYIQSNFSSDGLRTADIYELGLPVFKLTYTVLWTDYDLVEVIGLCASYPQNNVTGICDLPFWIVLTRVPANQLTAAQLGYVNQKANEAMAPFCYSISDLLANQLDPKLPFCSAPAPNEFLSAVARIKSTLKDVSTLNSTKPYYG